MYLALKHLHVTTVVLSFALFALRGVWMLADSAHLRRRWVRIVPHAIDVVLLASAVGLVLLLHQYPFVHGWLTAKVIGLLAYIVLGGIALKRGPTKAIRTMALVAAMLVFGYIVSVATTHAPLGFLLWW
ncbi:MAG: SirB2 family protein [Candidatus Competibacteraceae bacterium]